MKEIEVYIIESIIDGSWQPTTGTGLTRESAERKMEAWSKELPERQFRVVPYRQWRDGISLIAGLLMFALGLTGWADHTSRGFAEPGYYERQHLSVTGEAPQNYDSWTKQIERRRERGR